MTSPRNEDPPPSALGWMGDLPSRWSSGPLWAVATCNDEVLPENTRPDTEIRYVEISGVTEGLGITEVSDLTFSVAPSRARRKVEDGDVLVSTVRTYLRAIAPVISPPVNMVASTGFAVLRPRRITPRFLGYTVQAEYFVSEVISRSVGVSYPAVNASDLMRILVPAPPLPEQTAIATFLDRETGKIDALVKEQRRLIELLKEKRQAVISHAVTKGLDPNAKMKDSGVEWLGEVPEHWGVSTVGGACSYISYGFTNPMPTAEDGPHMLTANDIRDGHVDFDNARSTTFDAFGKLSAKSRPLSGDVLVTKDGTLGRVALYDGPTACINQSVALLRPDPAKMDSDFLALCLRGGVYQDRMVFEAGGTTIKHIYISRLGKMPLAHPPLPEQAAIARHLSAVAQQFDLLATQAGRAVDLLVERRAALISAAVTGRIDVREQVDAAVAA